MIITNKLTMDLTKPNWMAAIDAVQDDQYCRNLEITLLSGGDAWAIPEDASVLIRYSKSDGTGGIYDTMPDGTKAWAAEGNLLTAFLAPQVLTSAGSVLLGITISRGIHQISTFAVLISVHPAVGKDLEESQPYVSVHSFLPAPAYGTIGQFLRIAAVDDLGYITAVESADGTGSAMNTYSESGGVGAQQNPAAANSSLWSQWNSRLAFGMDTAAAPVPFSVGGQLLCDGTVIARNNGTQDKNRWGFHVYEAYAKDNYSRMTMLLDKHAAEAEGKPSLEFYYYTGSDHSAASYGNTKIGSDVAFHSFCFDRDKLTAYGAIDARMPVTLAKIRLSQDLNTAFESTEAADAAFEPELYPEENTKCLRYLALRNAENGAMFYDADRDQVACKIGGTWCSLPFTVIEDPAFDIFREPEETLTVQWANGIIDGNGDIAQNNARLYTPEYIPANAVSVTAKEGYEFCVVPFNGEGRTNAPNPYYDVQSGTFSSVGAVWYTAVDLTAISLGTGWIESESLFTNFKLLARRTDQAAIDPSEGSNIIIA